MTRPAEEYLARVVVDKGENRLVEAIRSGSADRGVFAAMVVEQYRIIASDRRSFLVLATRTEQDDAREFFLATARGESAALAHLDGLAAAVDLDAASSARLPVRPGCQAYPHFITWLALNATAPDAIVAMLSNFAAWGEYCATVATAMREHYGFGDEACAFFEFFAAPPTDEDTATAMNAIEAGLSTGTLTDAAPDYARLFQAYEMSFWDTLAEEFLTTDAR